MSPSEATRTEQARSTGAKGGSTVPCATCGGPVDPLRAARVAIFKERFRFFCAAECRERYDAESLRTPLPKAASGRHGEPGDAASKLEVGSELRRAELQAARALLDVAEQLDVGETASDTELLTSEGLERAPELLEENDSLEHAEPSVDASATSDVGSLLLMLAAIGGLLSVALSLTGDSSVAFTARAVLVVVSSAAVVAQYVMGARDASEANALSVLSAPVAATFCALAAMVSQHEDTGAALTLSGIVTAVCAGSIWLLQMARQPLELERELLFAELDQSAHRVVGDEVISVRAADLRPGEEIVIDEGEISPVDATVTAGTAVVHPWLETNHTAQRSEGDAIVAGTRIVSGRLRVVVGWAGPDRAWMRLTGDLRRRADLLSAPARLGRLTAERAAPLAAGLAALTAFAANLNTLNIAMAAIAAQAAIANSALSQIGALHVARTVLDALRRGIAFRTAEALDRTGRVSSVAFCARGTLLLGEPELANIEAVGGLEAEQVLALLAGAESGGTQPVARAVLRAARARGVRPDAVRSPTFQAGLGVTAVAANGQALVVGSRALMLKQRVSVASAEGKITDLEAMGRTVLLVALGGRLVGVVGLQDGLRSGARAAVQHLLDVGVEPVLLSGDARETCEALGRALDIEHLRPEVLPPERGEEVRRLSEGGATVAVIGRSPTDDVALSAADVSIALSTAGSSSAEWGVQLASDDVRDAAYAVFQAHRCRREARLGLVITLGASLGGALSVTFGLTPPWVAPLLSFAGTLAAVFRLRGRR